MSDPIELPGENPALPPNDFEFTCNIFFPLPTNGMEKFEVSCQNEVKTCLGHTIVTKKLYSIQNNSISC